MTRPVVGIDLGTSHTVVAWSLGTPGSPIRVFDLPQLVARGEIAARPLLPSVLYAPTEGEGDADPYAPIGVPWIGGEHARRRAAEVPARAVFSSKSWLCHARVDRTAAILPWVARHDESTAPPRVSPVGAAAHLLTHVRRAWDEAHPAHPLAEQDVVLTIPASFDEVARQLTLEAAHAAGIAPRLVEEPQAAFRDFLHHLGEGELARWVAAAGGELVVLVCDVGGGTTDLSLLRLRAEAGHAPDSVAIERIAVGRHLLVGGDNMDLALAHRIEPRMPTGRLEPTRFAELVQGCQRAKERLLRADAPEEATVTLLAHGSKLIGGSLHASLGRAEVLETVLGGFFPDPREPGPKARGGLLAFGLPYEPDVAITRHVRFFLERHGGAEVFPRALLLNGGVFHAEALRARLAVALDEWMAAERPEREPLELLPCPAPDLAVARGAVAHALALRGHGPRIGGGSARAFYVGVAADDGSAKAACVLPRGAREEETHRTARSFGLVVGRPVRFDLFASDVARLADGSTLQVEAGALVERGTLDRLSPAFVRFGEPEARTRRRRPAPAAGVVVSVVLEARLSSVGTLDLRCVEGGDEGRSFQVTFELRGEQPDERPHEKAASHPPPSAGAGKVEAARALVAAALLGDAENVRAVKDLPRDLEKLLGARDDWPLDVLRGLADELLLGPRSRRRSADSERVFWSLLGWSLRPGFGDPGDASRMRRVAPLFSERVVHADPRAEQQFFIAHRRLAGGFDERAQVVMRDALDPFIAPADRKLKRPKGFRPQSEAELLELLSWLERVPVPRRVELGGWLLERTWTSRDPRVWAALGRLGARRPAYASEHYAVPTGVAERWLDHLLRESWDDLPTAARAAVELARRTGDRARDVGEALRGEALVKLARSGAPERWLAAVREVVPPDAAERTASFGDQLPLGLRA